MGSDGIDRLFVAYGKTTWSIYMLADQLLSQKHVHDTAARIALLISVVEPGVENCFFGGSSKPQTTCLGNVQVHGMELMRNKTRMQSDFCDIRILERLGFNRRSIHHI